MEKSVLISGGSRGLGHELAEKFISDKWNVMTFSRSGETKEENVNGKLFISSRGDMRLDHDVRDVVKTFEEKFRGFRLLILNAGSVTRARNFMDSNLSELRKVFETNVFSNSLLIREFLKIESTKAVIHITSDASVNNYEGWAFYGSSKAAMDYIMRTLGAEIPEAEFISLDPGDMDTEMHREALPDADTNDLQKPGDAAAKLYERILEAISNDQ